MDYYTLQIHKEGPDGLGIFVCWTGQGNMALMVVLNGPSGDPREMVSASMFSESGGAKTQSESTNFGCERGMTHRTFYSSQSNQSLTVILHQLQDDQRSSTSDPQKGTIERVCGKSLYLMSI